MNLSCSSGMNMRLSEHAEIRIRQRGIPPLVVDLLMAYGAEARAIRCTRYFFDKPARRKVARAMGKQVMRRIENLLDAMIVVGDDGTVLTAGHRTERIRRL